MNKGDAKRQEILRFIQQFLRERGYSPSIREICTGVGLSSTSSVHSYLHELAQRGDIELQPTKKRALRIVTTAHPGIPMLGRVTAGLPLLAIENIEGYLPQQLLPGDKSNAFALRVVGDSMIGAGIFDGDTIIVRQSDVAENGDIVVADVGDGETTVKRFRREGNDIWLAAENPAYEPIRSRNIRIIGRLAACIRYYR